MLIYKTLVGEYLVVLLEMVELYQINSTRLLYDLSKLKIPKTSFQLLLRVQLRLMGPTNLGFRIVSLEQNPSTTPA